MSYIRKFNATITGRFDEKHKKVYQDILDLVKRENISKSKGAVLLMERGLEHTNNPRPLIDTPKNDVLKIHQKDTPKEDIKVEHLTDTPKVDVSKDTQKDTPLSVKEDPSTMTESGWIGWCIAGIVATLVGWKMAKAKGWF